jgi:hypothetical protein
VNKMWELFENIDLRSGSSKSMQARIAVASDPEGVTELAIRLPLAEPHQRQETPTYSSETV